MAITHEFVLKLLKGAAKRLRRTSPSLTQSRALDGVAALLGFNNWSLLSKHVRRLSLSELNFFHHGIYECRGLAELLRVGTASGVQEPVDREAAADEMRAWVENKFTPLVNFAYLDNESETGFAWPDEDLNTALQEEFGDVYPLDLIEDVASDMEGRGPWGIEDYGSDDQ